MLQYSHFTTYDLRGFATNQTRPKSTMGHVLFIHKQELKIIQLQNDVK